MKTVARVLLRFGVFYTLIFAGALLMAAVLPKGASDTCPRPLHIILPNGSTVDTDLVQYDLPDSFNTRHNCTFMGGFE